ncbi:MAG: DUF2029 domain-containing protein [Acidobacteria bacterium]|nr:DUF2029 domain-containing protein [Acidobacteriota bacterium]
MRPPLHWSGDTSRLRYVDAVGLWCAVGYAALALLARQPGEPGLSAFFTLVAWTGLPVFGLYWLLRRRGEPVLVGRLFFWAVVFRLCGLVGGPFYEDDFYRYLWDAYRFATTGTPYGAAPEAFFLDPSVPAAFQDVLGGINYPELPTIYGPTSQLVFLLGYWVQPASVTVLQVILIAVDLVTLGLLLRLTSTANVLLYAWCPLVVKEIAFTAHPDGAGACLLVAAILLARERRWPGAAVLLGLATGAKVFGLVLAPLVLARAGIRHWILFAATLAALYAPFALQGGTDLASLEVFAREWEFNSAAFGLLATVMPRFEARFALGLVFALFWVAYCRRYVRHEVAGRIPRGDWLYGALLVVSPVINPWYLLWLLPFAAAFPSAWAWTASVAVLLSYTTGLNLQDYTMDPYAQPLWVRWLEFGLILGALGFDWTRRGTPRAAGSEAER